MEEKYISKEIFGARMDLVEEKMNSLSREISHIAKELRVITSIVETLTIHSKDIESINRAQERNKHEIEIIKGTIGKIVWTIVSMIIAAIIQFLLNGGLALRR